LILSTYGSRLLDAPAGGPGICFNGILRANCFKMEWQEPEEPTTRKRKRPAAEEGPFVLRSLLADLPLSAEGDRVDVEINCVEFLGTCGMLMAFITLNLWLAITNNVQTRTYTLVHLLLKYSTSSKFLQTTKINPRNPPIF
jgi:hypothetical protein